MVRADKAYEVNSVTILRFALLNSATCVVVISAGKLMTIFRLFTSGMDEFNDYLLLIFFIASLKKSVTQLGIKEINLMDLLSFYYERINIIYF